MHIQMAFNILKNKLTAYSLGVIFFLANADFSLAQSKTDSLKSIWSNTKATAEKRFAAYEDYYQFLISAEPKAIVNSSTSHFKLAKKENSKKEMLLALGNQSQALSISGQDDKAIGILKRAFQIANKYNDSVSMAMNQVNRGIIHYNQGHYKEAVRNYTKSIGLFEKKKMDDRLAIVYSNLGVIFFEIDDLKTSLDYFKKSLALLKKNDSAEDSEFIWAYLGDVSYAMDNTKEALKYTRKSFKILENKNNNIGLADCHFLLARIFEKDGKNKQAIENIKLSLKLGLEIGNELNTNAYKIMLASLILDKDHLEATKIGEEVLSSIKQNTRNSTKVDVYNLLYKCYKKQGKTKLSLDMLEKHRMYNDSLIIEKSNTDILRDAIQSEFSSKLFESQIENEKVQSELKLMQLKRVFLIIFIAVVLFSILFLYYRSKLISNRKQRDELLKEIEKLKSNTDEAAISHSPNGFKLDREKIEQTINRKLNETDWKVLNILVEDPVIANKEIAEKAFMSSDGIGSSLRRMYDFFEIKESKYKKISLLLEAIKISNNQLIRS